MVVSWDLYECEHKLAIQINNALPYESHSYHSFCMHEFQVLRFISELTEQQVIQT